MNDNLLIVAGCIGVIVAIFHGVLMQRLMIKPILTSQFGQEMQGPLTRLLPLLLHFTTAFWLFAGLALIIAPYVLNPTMRLAVSIVAISFYTYGALGNLWGTRGKHPGWILLSFAVILILLSLR